MESLVPDSPELDDQYCPPAPLGEAAPDTGSTLPAAAADMTPAPAGAPRTASTAQHHTQLVLGRTPHAPMPMSGTPHLPLPNQCGDSAATTRQGRGLVFATPAHASGSAGQCPSGVVPATELRASGQRPAGLPASHSRALIGSSNEDMEAQVVYHEHNGTP